LVKEAAGIYISARDSKTLREAGFLTELDKFFAKANLHFVLFHGDGDGYYIFAGKQIARPQDLKGMMMRSAATYDAMFRALGCSPVNVPASDAYSAMERHIVDGYAYPLSPLPETGLIEVTKTFIDHMVLGGGSIMFMNLDAWKKLPPDVQKIINDINVQMEPEILAFWKQHEMKTREQLKARKVDMVKFSDKDAKWYTDTARKASLDELLKQAPQTAPALMKLAGY
jgi:TRAP-type transport system periplasmic protein